MQTATTLSADDYYAQQQQQPIGADYTLRRAAHSEWGHWIKLGWKVFITLVLIATCIGVWLLIGSEDNKGTLLLKEAKELTAGETALLAALQMMGAQLQALALEVEVLANATAVAR